MKRTTLILASALVLGGCGGSHQTSPTVKTSTPTATTTNARVGTTSTQPATTQDTRAMLRAAVRAALLANHHLAIRVLWTNRVPSDATRSTRGPALAGIRASARDRQSRGVRVRMIRDNYRVASIVLDSSDAGATAVAQSIQTVVPSHLNGRPLGRSVRLNERARIVLRRLGTSKRFVVWNITLLK
jgi:hypothetical protein